MILRLSALLLTMALLLTCGRLFYIHFEFFVPADRAVTEARRAGTMGQYIRALDAVASAADCVASPLCFSPRWTLAHGMSDG